jgi:succinyl-diaminopimelate desuccinylase
MSLRRTVQSYRNGLIRLTRQLVEIPTVNPPGEKYREIVDFLDGKCKELGMKTRRIRTPNSVVREHGGDVSYPRINLIADYGLGFKKTFHFNGHTDVVPVTKKWKTDPFKAVLKGNRLYGRGTCDMKGNIAAGLYALRALQDTKTDIRANIQFSFTTDEETGGETGLGYLAKKGLVRASYALGESGAKIHFSIGNKGIYWAKVVVKGKPGHGAYPYTGDNSFEHLLRVGNRMRELQRKIVKRRTKYATADPRDKKASMVMGGILKGGNKANIIPAESSFSIDRRILPEEGLEKARQEIATTLGKASKNVEIKVLQEAPPVAVDLKHPFVKVVGGAVRAVYSKCRPVLQSGGTDMRFLLYRKIPSLGYGAHGANFHGDNEYVSIPDLVKTTEVYARIMSSVS